MTCPDGQHLLQRHLDGDADAVELERHLRDCPACAAAAPAVRRLMRGVALLTAERPPEGLADRVASRLSAEAARVRRARRARRFALAGLAAAAALAVGVGLWAWWPANGAPAPYAEPRPAPVEAGPPAPLRDSMARAGGAVSTMTNRAAADTADNTAALWALLPMPALEPPPEAAPDLSPLQEAGTGAGAAFAPVTTSARRAVGLFLRDLPLPQPPDKKPS